MVQIEQGWLEVLQDEFEKEYFQGIKSYLSDQLKAGKTLYPPGSQIFNAYDLTPFSDVKVVIIGQDPYHNPGQAMGLCFSVPKAIAIPASLKNIYKEIKRDLGFEPPDHGDLTYWAQQGVLLLNAVLTVEKNKPASHRKIGWHEFTDATIKALSDHKENLVFLLWGNFAKSKKAFIDQTKHHVLESVHPSPLAGNKFIGNNHFSTTNKLLQRSGLKPINWQLL